MISTNDLKSGQSIVIEGQIYQVIEAMHVKPGKGQAFVRAKLRNIKTGGTIDRTLPAGDRVEQAHVERRPVQYLYSSGDEYHLMDSESYEQYAVSGELLGRKLDYLKENMELTVVRVEDQIVDVELPVTVELAVTETDPGLKGDTASGGSKPAKLETGATIKVPLFISVGDVLKVDTRTGEYISRA